MYGGFSNEWCANRDLEYGDCPESDRISRNDIPRLRQYYLSMDIDFSKIPKITTITNVEANDIATQTLFEQVQQ